MKGGTTSGVGATNTRRTGERSGLQEGGDRVQFEVGKEWRRAPNGAAGAQNGAAGCGGLHKMVRRRSGAAVGQNGAAGWVLNPPQDVYRTPTGRLQDTYRTATGRVEEMVLRLTKMNCNARPGPSGWSEPCRQACEPGWRAAEILM